MQEQGLQQKGYYDYDLNEYQGEKAKLQQFTQYRRKFEQS